MKRIKNMPAAKAAGSQIQMVKTGFPATIRRGFFTACMGAVMLTLWGCIPDLMDIEPDVGDLLVKECENADHNPDVDVSFSRNIRGDLFITESTLPEVPNNPPNTCLKCHDPSSGSLFGAEYSGFDVSSYKGVMQGGVNSGSDIVIPGKPCKSFLYLKLTPGVPVGSRMPLTGPYFSEEDMALLADWITEGANDN